jgi:hypothetical protein
MHKHSQEQLFKEPLLRRDASAERIFRGGLQWRRSYRLCWLALAWPPRPTVPILSSLSEGYTVFKPSSATAPRFATGHPRLLLRRSFETFRDAESLDEVERILVECRAFAAASPSILIQLPILLR